MQKIVHIMLAGPVTDGWTYQDNIITKYHKKMGCTVTMITSQWIWSTYGKLEKTDKTNYINADGVKVIRLPLKGKDDFSKKYKCYVGLKNALESEAPDIIFIHNVSFGDVGVIVSYIKNHSIKKVYVDNHSDFSNSGTSWISRNILHKIIWKFNAKQLEQYVSKFYGVLPARVDWLVNMYDIPREKCELLVIGGDDDEVDKASSPNTIAEVKDKYRIKEEDFLIVTGGKIDEAKRQTLLLIQAVQNIQNEHIRLVVFGSVADSLKDDMNKLTDGCKVQYIGWINAQDSYKYFAAADLVVFPGRHSVFWEQVAAQGIPMICKYWDGTTHVDVGGNVAFLMEDSVESIQYNIENIAFSEKITKMKFFAEIGRRNFLYSEIAKKSIQ
jgi:1,2-diacylglycerol 3-alpha-glucosyltransferase